MNDLSFTDMGPMTAEARALHAVLDDDVDEAERILRDFLPGELRALERACGVLSALCGDIRRDPMQDVETGGPTTAAIPPNPTTDTAREERS